MPTNKLQIALIGYGKMGKIIEELAHSRGHEVTLRISSQNQAAFNAKNLADCNVAIEFSTPEVAYGNLKKLAKNKVATVCGTTGWLDHYDEIVQDFKQAEAPLLYASNFSVGVNIFFELNKKLATLMKDQISYSVDITENHHITKKDAPSGTAVTLANQLINTLPDKEVWTLGQEAQPSEIPITAIREGDVKGDHTIKYRSEIDQITISHQAFTREGFALGAILGAEYVYGKNGIVEMREVLGLDPEL